MSPHPAEEILDAYAAGLVSLPDREAVERHVLDCDDCLNALILTTLALRVTQRFRRSMEEEDDEVSAPAAVPT